MMSREFSTQSDWSINWFMLSSDQACQGLLVIIMFMVSQVTQVINGCVVSLRYINLPVTYPCRP